MMRDRVTSHQRLEIAKDTWLTIKITMLYVGVTALSLLIIFVLLKIIGVI